MGEPKDEPELITIADIARLTGVKRQVALRHLQRRGVRPHSTSQGSRGGIPKSHYNRDEVVKALGLLPNQESPTDENIIEYRRSKKKSTTNPGVRIPKNIQKSRDVALGKTEQQEQELQRLNYEDSEAAELVKSILAARDAGLEVSAPEGRTRWASSPQGQVRRTTITPEMSADIKSRGNMAIRPNYRLSEQFATTDRDPDDPQMTLF